MNEQLKQQLIKQAGFHTRPSIENTVSGIDWNSGNWGYDQCVDRLIELVANECADIVEKKIGVSRYVHEAELLRECSTTIKEHFGVE